MQSNDPQFKLSNDHQREYPKEQECPKAMATSSEKMEGFSADMMIENLLKKSFKKLPEMPVKLDHSYAELPLWLQCNSTTVPAQYKYLWTLVQSTVDLADTQKVSQLLLTSGLPVDMLGFIWSLANKAIPGQLTKQEFYIVLALISLIQSGYAFNNLNILKLLTVPTMPMLQIGLMNFPVPQSNSLQKTKSAGFNSIREFPALQLKPSFDLSEDRDSFSNRSSNKISSNNKMKDVVSQNKNIEENFAVITASSRTSKPLLTEHTKDIHKNSNFPCIGLSLTAELEDDFSAFQSVSAEKDSTSKIVNQSIQDSSDEFSEFQSANLEHVDPFETVVIDQKREIPKIPLPKTLTGKFINVKSNILKISPESGKKLKALSAAESLSSLPESKISSSNKVSTCIPVLGSNHGIGSRLANHSLSSQFEVPQGTTKHHKHHKIKINPSSPPSEVILGVKTKNLETVIPKCCPKNSKAYKTFVLKETKIRDDDGDVAAECLEGDLGIELDSSGVHLGEKTRQIEIPMLGTFNETILPTQSKPQISNVDLITVQEDKYSALREIELELSREKNSDIKEINDEFGDFLSADISAFDTWKSFQSSTKTPNWNSDLVFFTNEDKGNWGNLNPNTKLSLDLSNTSNAKPPPVNDFVGISNVPLFSNETNLFGQFNLLTFDNGKEISPSNSFLSNHQDCFDEYFKSGSADNSVIFMEKNEKSHNLTYEVKKDEMSINDLGDEFWSFVSSESIHANTSVGHDSPAQLGFNASPINGSDQEIIWKKCIDSCHSLIQKGFDIFNNVAKKSVLDEVFAAPETENYLNNLNIVCQISKRVSQNFSGFSSAQNELEKLWRRLLELCFEYNIKLRPDEDSFSDGEFQCGICLTYVGPDVVNQGNSSYHPSCANLWINYVEGVLPSLV